MYQSWRNDLIKIIRIQINELNTELVIVKLRMQYVERYKNECHFVCLTEQDKHDLIKKHSSISVYG